jgi:hypothetical protein
MTGFIITKLVREHVAVESGPNGRSYGQLLDELMDKAANAKEEISLVEFEIEPEDWAVFMAQHAPVEVQAVEAIKHSTRRYK